MPFTALFVKLRKIAFSVAACFIILLAACTKKNTPGQNQLPQEFQPGFKQITVHPSSVYSYAEKNVKSDELSSLLLGAINDPLFGVSEAGIILNFVLSESNPDFGSNPVADSVVFDLPYTGLRYGKSDKLHGAVKFKIYQCDQTLYRDSSYYSDFDPAAFRLGNVLLHEDWVLIDPAQKFSSYKTFHMNMPLGFGQRFLNNPASINNNINLQNFFGGITIEPQISGLVSESGNICGINLNTALNCGFTIYYHNDVSTSLKFSLKATTDGTRLNYFKHQKTPGSELASYLNDTSKQDKCFIQFMAGVSTCLSFDSLKLLSLTNKIITRADLIIPVYDTGNENFPIAPRLLLVLKNDDGNYVSVPDYTVSESYFDGNYDPALKAYRFNISVFVQDVLKNNINFKALYLVPFGSGISPYRIVLKGKNDIRLKLTYAEML